MGNQAKPPPKKMTLEDSIIEMKMQSKTLQRAAKKAEKQSEKYKKKAKDSLKKNDEESAKMYLMSAASKHNEFLSTQRIALKMDYMCGQVKSMKNNEQLINNFTALTNVASQSMGTFNFETMSNQMEMFNNKMDEMMINNKMMTEIMTGTEVGNDMMVQDMKNALQQEIAMQEKNKLMEQEKKMEEKYVNQNKGFMDELKGL